MKHGRNRIYREKSAEVIVVIGNEPKKGLEDPQDIDGLNLKSEQQ